MQLLNKSYKFYLNEIKMSGYFKFKFREKVTNIIIM